MVTDKRKEGIEFLITGGTFDKEYNFITGELYFEDTHIPEMLELGRCTVPGSFRTLMMIDSLQMTEDDREIVRHHCERSKHDKIIVTHGTDTMIETAKVLHEAKIEGKTIVLTGAMIPYAFGSSSDGFFNLGAAIAFVQANSPGVYVSMNGRCFNYDEVMKNRKTGFFEELS